MHTYVYACVNSLSTHFLLLYLFVLLFVFRQPLLSYTIISFWFSAASFEEDLTGERERERNEEVPKWRDLGFRARNGDIGEQRSDTGIGRWHNLHRLHMYGRHPFHRPPARPSSRACPRYRRLLQPQQCWREIFPSHVRLFVQNDAVAALASGTMGKLHGCVLIAGTGTIAYGFTEDGGEARAAGAGPVLGDWGSGYGIAAQALTAVIRAHDGRGPHTMLTRGILRSLELSSPDELIGWTYADPSWARIAALVPVVVSCAEAGDEVANKILLDAVEELASSVKAVVQRLRLSGEDGKDSFHLVMVGGVLEANKRWDIGKEVIDCITNDFPGAVPIRPRVEPAVGAALLAWNFLMRQSQ